MALVVIAVLILCYFGYMAHEMLRGYPIVPFSLRTLLIATTLVAVVLGLIV